MWNVEAFFFRKEVFEPRCFSGVAVSWKGVLDEMSKRRPSLSVCLAVLSWCLTLRWATGRIKKTKNVVIRFPLVRALSWCVCASPLRLLEQSWARFVMGILAKPPRETACLNYCCSYIGDAWWEEWDTPTPLWGFFGGVGLVPSLQINSSFSQEQCYDGSHHCLSKLS